ncbi:MAG: hypothetical protein K2X27_09035, partial [Candidatus Obscuribacterales bacterium]|nr:hypothetical protein [Candidatus Obscuribacterales bacterium]
TQQGTVISMKGEGVPHLSHPDRRGDQLVHLFIETPTKLSDEEKELYRKLSELRGEKLELPESERPAAAKEQSGQKDHKDAKEGHHSIFDAIAGVFKGKHAGGE